MPGSGDDTTRVDTTPSAGASFSVTFEVEGSGRGIVSFTGELTTIDQDVNAHFPWSKSITGKKNSGDFGNYVMSALRMDGSGPLTCRIKVDGTVVSEITNDQGSPTCSTTVR